MFKAFDNIPNIKILTLLIDSDVPFCLLKTVLNIIQYQLFKIKVNDYYYLDVIIISKVKQRSHLSIIFFNLVLSDFFELICNTIFMHMKTT